VLWMGGGMGAPDTFDPKRYEPFEVGKEVASVLSTFPSIRTSVDHISRSAKDWRILLKLWTARRWSARMCSPILGSILHSRHQYHWHTGYVPPQTVACPHIGSWVARVLGPNNPVIPPFINIGQRLEGVGEQEELKGVYNGWFLWQ
jgi:hypothetical protein